MPDLSGNLKNGSSGPAVPYATPYWPHEDASVLGVLVNIREFPHIEYGATEPEEKLSKRDGKPYVPQDYAVDFLYLAGDIVVRDEVLYGQMKDYIKALQDAGQHAQAKAYKDNTPIPTRAPVPGELVRHYIKKRQGYYGMKDAIKAIKYNIHTGQAYIVKRVRDEWVDPRTGVTYENAKRIYNFTLREAVDGEIAWLPHAEAMYAQLAATNLSDNVDHEDDPFPSAPPAQPVVAAPPVQQAMPVAAPAPAPVVVPPVPPVAAPAPAPVAAPVVAAPPTAVATAPVPAPVPTVPAPAIPVPSEDEFFGAN